MAARRLIVVMLILLGISTLLAALLPDRVPQSEDEQTASQTTSTPSETTAAAPPEPCKTVLKCFELDADEKKIAVIPVEAGDQLVLEVAYSADDLVEIGELGFIDVVGPGNPATFDIFTDRPGTYGIRLVDAARTIGRIEVTEPATEK